jgi:hypothetical protein
MNRHGDIDELERLVDEADPIAAHAKIMELTRPQPVIVHKRFSGQQLSRATADNDDDHLPLIDDSMIDAVAEALAETRNKLRDEFQNTIENATGSLVEQVAMLQSQTATLQGQVGVLLNLIGTLVNNTNGNGNNGTKSVEVSEIQTTRRVRVRRTSSHKEGDGH